MRTFEKGIIGASISILAASCTLPREGTCSLPSCGLSGTANVSGSSSFPPVAGNGGSAGNADTGGTAGSLIIGGSIGFGGIGGDLLTGGVFSGGSNTGGVLQTGGISNTGGASPIGGVGGTGGLSGTGGTGGIVYECLETGLRVRFVSALGGRVVQANASLTGDPEDLQDGICLETHDLDSSNAIFECCLEYDSRPHPRIILVDFVYANTAHACSISGCGNNSQYSVWVDGDLVPEGNFDRLSSCGDPTCPQLVRVNIP